MREDILQKRYYRKDKAGNVVENWDGLCSRVARAIATNDKEYNEFFSVINECLFLPNTPALTNAGREGFSMSACFVLPVEDSMEGIFDAVKYTALIHKMGGGTGFDFSRLRPKGDVVASTRGVASGPCSFMEVFNAATHVTKQGGTRRGANMGILRVDHPDIEKFIELKKQEGALSNFNLSVAITDEFIDALRRDGNFDLSFNGKRRKTVKAREIWDAIIEGAWRNGEPGLVFINEINQANPTPHIGKIEATNPCGEQPLLPYEACVLGSVNLSKMVSGGEIDYERLADVVRIAVRFLDNVIDIQHYPLPEIEAMHKSNRKIGLGVMGWADMLIQLGIPYNSARAVELAEKVMSYISQTSIEESSRLAEEKGVFPNWEGSVWHKKGIRLRNATTTTIAPTGSISIIADCSSGIEPVFEWETVQNRVDGEFRVVHPLYKEWIETRGKPLPDYFVTAKDVPVEWHIKMQAAFQKYVHNAVSKTINLPNKASKEDVEKAFLLAYETGCKGITVYRDGSRKKQVISKTSASTSKGPKSNDDLPAVMDAKRVCIETAEGKVYVNISIDNTGRPVEVFIITPVESKHSEIYESFGRIFSIALQGGISIEKMLAQLEHANRKYGSASSIPAAILRAFRMLKFNGTAPEVCPECGGILVLEEGCMKCISCGYSKC